MNEREIADAVLNRLHEGVVGLEGLAVPWRYPINVSPEFKPTFGRFFTGEPLTEAEVSYDQLDAIIAANHAYLFDAVAQAERTVNHLLDLRRRWAGAA